MFRYQCGSRRHTSFRDGRSRRSQSDHRKYPRRSDRRQDTCRRSWDLHRQDRCRRSRDLHRGGRCRNRRRDSSGIRRTTRHRHHHRNRDRRDHRRRDRCRRRRDHRRRDRYRRRRDREGSVVAKFADSATVVAAQMRSSWR